MYILLLILLLHIGILIECNNDNNNWVVIVNTSRYWYNYRHLTNALTIYSTVKKLGIPDDHIIFMNAFDYACDTRNSLPGRIYYNQNHNDINFDDDNTYNDDNLYNNVEIDYKGSQVKVTKFMNIMIGNYDSNDPINGKLLSDSNSTILLYLSGHGGDEFLKFQDNEEITAKDISIIIKRMEILKRYKQLLIIADTCQASTLANYITSPNVIFITSSMKGENSYAYHISDKLGVSLIDRFTYKLHQFFINYVINNEYDGNNYNALTTMTLQHLLDFMDHRFLYSTANVAVNTGLRALSNIPVIEFFGSSNSISSRGSGNKGIRTKYNIINNDIISQYDNNDTININDNYYNSINDLHSANIIIGDIYDNKTTSSIITNDNDTNRYIIINLLLSLLLCLLLSLLYI